MRDCIAQRASRACQIFGANAAVLFLALAATSEAQADALIVEQGSFQVLLGEQVTIPLTSDVAEGGVGGSCGSFPSPTVSTTDITGRVDWSTGASLATFAVQVLPTDWNTQNVDVVGSGADFELQEGSCGTAGAGFTDYIAPFLNIQVTGVEVGTFDIVLSAIDMIGNYESELLGNPLNLCAGESAFDCSPQGSFPGLVIATVTVNADTDGDGMIDSVDSDDDNDGVIDTSDSSSLNPDICEDADGDGCDDCSVGTDNFGTSADNLPNNDGTDTDGDGACNDGVTGDSDDDNDGVIDTSDSSPLNPNICEDADGDGCDDCSVGTDNFGTSADNLPNNDGTDTDGDGACNDGATGDSDDDNDGVPDGSDSSSLNPDVCEDVDGDGCDDCSVGTDDFGTSADNLPNDDGTDTDGDGMCNDGATGDSDDDNDGVTDTSDSSPLNPDICEDADGDGCDDCSVGTDNFGESDDNLPNNDGADEDADGSCDVGDNCLGVPNRSQTDTDMNGIGDLCDASADLVDPDDLIVVDSSSNDVVLVRRGDGTQVAINDMTLISSPTGLTIDGTLRVIVVQNQDPKVIGLDAFTGEEQQIANNDDNLGDVYDVAFRRSDQMIFMTDANPLVAGQPIAVVDGNGGSQFFLPLTSGPALAQARGILVTGDGNLLVVDQGLTDPILGCCGGVALVNAQTGSVQALSVGGLFVAPEGVALARDGTILVADPQAFGGGGGVISVDPSSGLQSPYSCNGTDPPRCSNGNDFVNPTAITVDSENNAIVGDGDRVLRVEPQFGLRSLVSSGVLLAETAGLVAVPFAVSESFEDSLVGDSVGMMIDGELVFSVRDDVGDVVVSMKGQLAEETTIETGPNGQFWKLKTKDVPGVVDPSMPILVADIPGVTGASEMKSGQFADFFADGPKDLKDFTISAKLRVGQEAVANARGSNGTTATDATVSFQVTDDQGNTAESADMALSSEFLTMFVDISEQNLFPVGGAFSVDLSRILAVSLSFGSTAAASGAIEVDIDDPTIVEPPAQPVPEPTKLLLQACALALIFGVARARRSMA